MAVIAVCATAGVYVSRIHIYGDFTLEVWQDSTNVTDKTEITGISVFDRENKLPLQGSHYTNVRWYYKKMRINCHSEIASGTLRLQFRNNKGDVLTEVNIPYQKGSPCEITGMNTHDGFFTKCGFLAVSTLRTLFIEQNITGVINLLVVLFLVVLLVKYGKFKKTEPVETNKVNLFKVFRYVALGLYALLTINLIYLSLYFFPNADDLGITQYIINYKNPILSFYRDIDGRYFTNFLYMALNPLVYGLPPAFFRVIPLILFAGLSHAVYYVITKVNSSKSKKDNLTVAAFLVFMYVIYVRNLASGFFYMGTSYHYTVLVIIFCYFLGSVLTFLRKPTWGASFAVGIFLFLFHGTDEYSVMLSTPPVVITVMYLFSKYKGKLYFLIPVIIIYVPTLIFMISSPGHANRMLTDADPYLISQPIFYRGMMSIYSCTLTNLIEAWNAFLNHTFIIPLAILFLYMAAGKMRFDFLNTVKTRHLVLLVILTNLYILCFVPLPYFYAGLFGRFAGTDSFQFHNITYFLFLVINLIFIIILSQKNISFIERIYRIISESGMSKGLLAILFFLVFTGHHKVFKSTLSDIRNNRLELYYDEITERHESLYKNKLTDVILIPGIRNKPLSMYSGMDYYSCRTFFGKETFYKYLFKEFVFTDINGQVIFKYKMLDELKQLADNLKPVFIRKPHFASDFIQFVTAYYPNIKTKPDELSGLFLIDYALTYSESDRLFNLIFVGTPTTPEHGVYEIKFNISEFEKQPWLFSGAIGLTVDSGDFLFIKTFPITPDSLITDLNKRADIISRKPALDVTITGISKRL